MQIISATGIPSEEAFGGFVKFNFIVRNVGKQTPNTIFASPTLHMSVRIEPGLATAYKAGTPNFAIISDKPVISSIIDTILPNHIVEDYPRFIQFIQGFFEWTELRGKFGYEQKRLIDNQDIDKTDLDFYFECFRKEFLVNIPQNILADKAKLLKVIREYYQSRGSEKSFEMFFRFLLDKESDFFYPRVDMLRASDGKWIQKRSIRVTQLTGNAFNLNGRVIRGRDNNATAFVENVQRVQVGTFTVFELFLNRQSIIGEFDINEVIEDGEGLGVTATILPMVVGLNLDYAGEGYTANEEIDIISIGTGAGARAVIKSVGFFGEILEVEVKDFGAGYFNEPLVQFPLTYDTASGTVVLGAVGSYPGFFLNNDGFLSDLKYLQDGNFYQQFSYVTIVDESLDVYSDILLDSLHPAGWKHFGQVRSQNLVFAGSRVSNLQACSQITLCMEQYNSPTQFGNTEQYSEIILRASGEQTEQTKQIGPTYNSLDRVHKFNYKPYEAFNAETEVQGSINSGYWNNYANTQVKDFNDFIIKDFYDTPYKTISIQPESNIRTYVEGTITSFGIGSGEQFGNSEVDV